MKAFHCSSCGFPYDSDDVSFLRNEKDEEVAVQLPCNCVHEIQPWSHGLKSHVCDDAPNSNLLGGQGAPLGKPKTPGETERVPRTRPQDEKVYTAKDWRDWPAHNHKLSGICPGCAYGRSSLLAEIGHLRKKNDALDAEAHQMQLNYLEEIRELKQRIENDKIRLDMFETNCIRLEKIAQCTHDYKFDENDYGYRICVRCGIRRMTE